MWTKKGFSQELQKIILWVIIAGFIIGFFFILKEHLFEASSGVTKIGFRGLGFR
ncbi:hypothetical protein K9M74_02505 [Candidatus Woesearchaeota archaeon]|nr:hypothetical protein [Candidatus Woesearchaeota archaeon]